MPEIKISEFPELDTPVLTDIIPILDLSETDVDLINKKVTLQDVLNLVPPGEVNTASNLGLGEPIFDSKVGTDLQFKSLVAGENIVISSNLTNISISSDSFSCERLDLSSTTQLNTLNKKYLYLIALNSDQNLILESSPIQNTFHYIVRRGGNFNINIQESSSGPILQTLTVNIPVAQCHFDGVEWQIISFGTV